MSAPLVLDIFGGPGGWCWGMRGLGVRTLGLEWDAAACATRAAAGLPTVRCDVAALPVEPLAGKVHGLCGGPPCPSFSSAGKGEGRAQLPQVLAAVDACRDGWTAAPLGWAWSDPRTPLVLQPLRYAWALRPQWLAMEQVPPVLPIWQHMAHVLRGWGYSARAVVLNAADYGVPQTRRRAVLLASLGPLHMPVATHARQAESAGLFGDGRERWVTAAEALRWPSGGRIRSNQNSRVGRGHRTIIRYSRCVDRPAPVVMSSSSTWRHEPREGATEKIRFADLCILQSFPPDYPFRGAREYMFTQVGNAIPPLMARAIVSALHNGPAPTDGRP